ncbi:MAG: response regulator [Phycisphaerae bacterium]|nr:response regulator [Phycisphaerae bacterium]MDW8261732.1 response regulator [Phycisphaerales bacterium]
MHGNGDILVVEDDSVLNELLGAYVQLAGFQYRPARDAESALREVQSRPPALVILDLMLPDLDGFEVCRRLRASPATAKVPILMLTALNTPESRRRGLECGASEYLTKPFDPDTLIEAIRRHAPRR